MKYHHPNRMIRHLFFVVLLFLLFDPLCYTYLHGKELAMEGFEIPDSIHKLFLNESSKSLKIMNKYMAQEEKCEYDNNAYELGTELQKSLGVWVVCFFSIVGILLNTLCIRASASIAVDKKAPKNLFNILLLNLLSWDTVFLILNISRKMAHFVNKDTKDKMKCSPEMAKIIIPLWNIALAQSVFATLLMSIERYICIIHEKIYSKYIQFDKRRLNVFLQWVMPATLLVFLVHVPEFLAQNPDVRIEIGHNGNTNQKACFNLDQDAKPAAYFKVFAKVFIDGFFPLIGLLYCNTRTFLKVRENIRISFRKSQDVETRPLSNEQKKAEDEKEKLIRAIEHKLAKIMIGIVSLFILCQIPYLILTAHQSYLITEWLMHGKDSKCEIYPPYIVVMEPFVHLMLTINCSVNVVFYCFFDSGYRERIFHCSKNNQETDGKDSGICSDENKEKNSSEEVKTLTSPDINEGDHSYGEQLF